MKHLFTTLFMMLLMAVGGMAQEVLPLPFHEDFDHHDNFSFIDSNEDYKGFGLLFNPATGGFGTIRYDDRDAFKTADDWIIFPYFKFQEGLKYTLTVSMRMSGEGAAKFDCHLGKGSDDMDDALITTWTKVNNETWLLGPESLNEWKEYSIVLTSPFTGNYRLALHFTSPINNQTYEMDWLELSEGMTAGAPARSTCTSPTYSVVDGKLNVKFNITAPGVDCYGDPLGGGLSARVIRRAENRLDKTFQIASVTSGQAYQFTDDDGFGTPAEYDVYIYNGTKCGMKTTVASNPTLSKPAAPTNVTISYTGGNTFAATWDAITTGQSSYLPFIPGSVTYSATDYSGNPVELEMTSPTSAVFEFPEVKEGQIAAYLNLYGTNEAGTGTAGKSNSIVIGQPLQGTFREDFSDKKFNTEVWSPLPATGAWSVTSSSVSGTDGKAGVLSYGQAAGQSGELVSPILDLSDMTRPFVTMWVYIKPSSTYNNSITPVIRGYQLEQEYPLCEAFTDHVMADGSPLPEANGWHKYVWQIKGVPAETLAKCNLVLKGSGDSSWNYVYMDEIVIKDYPADMDLAILEAKADKEARVGIPAPISVTVENRGFGDFDPFTLYLMNGDDIVDSVECDCIKAENSRELTLHYTALPHHADSTLQFTVRISPEGDELEENNTGIAYLKVALNLLPVTQNLEVAFGTEQDILTWEAPIEGENGLVEVNENFEDWLEGPIQTGILNDWTFYDIDGNLTWGYDSDDPSYKQQIAAEIHSKGGIDNSNGLLVPKCNNEATGGVYGTPDKWIILPRLGAGTSVTFKRYAKNCFGASSRVLLDYCSSVSGTSPEDFDNVIETEEIASRTAAEWTEKTVTIPEDAEYFAIHVRDCQAGFIAFDDFNYITLAGAPILQGYNVYFNNTKIASLGTDDLSYRNVLEYADQDTKKTYYVSAVYDQGESAAGTIVKNKSADIFGFGEEAAEANFRLNGDILTANGDITIIDLAGRIIATLSPQESIQLEAGIYIARSKGSATKFLIKN